MYVQEQLNGDFDITYMGGVYVQEQLNLDKMMKMSTLYKTNMFNA